MVLFRRRSDEEIVKEARRELGRRWTWYTSMAAASVVLGVRAYWDLPVNNTWIAGIVSLCPDENHVAIEAATAAAFSSGVWRGMGIGISVVTIPLIVLLLISLSFVGRRKDRLLVRLYDESRSEGPFT